MELERAVPVVEVAAAAPVVFEPAELAVVLAPELELELGLEPGLGLPVPVPVAAVEASF